VMLRSGKLLLCVRPKVRLISADQRINQRRFEIENDALTLIATQQPMAGDLREVLAISAIATDLERIADHAKSIAAGRLNLDSGLPSEPLIELSQMAALARELLARSVDAFVERDGDLATEVAARDEEVDVRYHRITRRLLALMYEQPSTISSAYFLLKVAKNIERAGDHVTNICERVVFLVTGRIVDLGR